MGVSVALGSRCGQAVPLAGYSPTTVTTTAGVSTGLAGYHYRLWPQPWAPHALASAGRLAIVGVQVAATGASHVDRPPPPTASAVGELATSRLLPGHSTG